MRIIDVHTHIFSNVTRLQYGAKCGCDIRPIIIQYWNDGLPPRYPLAELIRFAKPHKMPVIAAVNIHHNRDEQLATLLEHKGDIEGVKLYLGYQHMYPFDDWYKPFIDFCIAYDKVVTMHTGATSRRGSPLLEYAHPLHIDRFARKYPQCKVIAAHFGFPWMMDTATVISAHERVYTDISGIFDVSVSRDELLHKRLPRTVDDVQRCIDYFPEVATRVMFGTDYGGDHTPLCEVQLYKELVQRVFSITQQEAVLYQTAQTVFKL